jgi:hypothetical protein
MEANMQQSTTHILSVFDDIFNEETCYQLAKQHQFIQRNSSKIRGHEFVKALVLPAQGSLEDSLNDICTRMRQFNPDADISAPALAQRINKTSAARFMKTIFEKILQSAREKFEKQDPSLEGLLKSFNNIFIQDSTIFEINKKLSRYFPGTKRGGKKGGNSCKAQVKIDLIQNFATGKIEDVQIYEGKRPDQSLSDKIIRKLKAGDLVLRDLGYFKIEVFKTIMSVGAFFISRFPSHVKVYLNQEDSKSVSLGEYLNKHYKNQSMIDLTVWISDERMKVRLIAYRMPKDVVKERLRKTNKSAKEMGRKTSKQKLALLEFSIFISNIPKDVIAGEMIGTIYRLRWEVELIFKRWKSQLKLDILEGICLHRIQCLLWSRLSLVIIIAHITAGFFNSATAMCKGEISPTKVIQYLLKHGCLSQAIANQTLKEFESRMLRDIPKKLMKDKRIRTTMRQRVNEFEPYYGWCCAA